MAKPADDIAESSIELPVKLDQAACDAFVDSLTRSRGKPLRVNAASLEFLGGQGAEILLRARMAWRAEDLAFTVTDPSEALLDGLDLLGIPRDQLIGEVAR